MKTINKIVSGFAMVALLASCSEKELPDSTVIPASDGSGSQSDAVVPTEIVATFEETKVTYNEIEAGSVYNLRPTWEVGDKIIALGEDGANYKFTVKTVTGDKSAILSGEVPANCSLHLIYCPGVSATSAGAEGLSLPINVDYTAQTGAQKTMPAVMFSDGEIKDGTGDFTFRNAGAIIGISAVKGVPSGAAISKFTVEGANLSAATVSLDGSTLKLTAATAATGAISTAALSGITTTDDNGTLSTPVFIAVPAGAKIARLSTNPIQAREPETAKIPSTAADKKDIDYVEIAAKYDGTNVTTKKWAKWNVGANSPSDYGWYFAWAGTEGYIWKNSKWVSVTGVDTYCYTLSSVKTAGASDYLYVRTQSFTPAGHHFEWFTTPYQTQNTTSHSSTKFTKYLGSTTSSYKDPSATDADALKTALDPEDDAARANWGGTWRMPTIDEFEALVDATYWKWDSADKGYYVYAPNPARDAGRYNENGVGTYDKANALLFFPAAGIGYYASPDYAGHFGDYWSSSLHSSYPYYAYLLVFHSGGVGTGDYNDRYYGEPVRPLSD